MATDYFVNVGDGENFINNVKPGDRLWFVQGESNRKIFGISTYRSQLGPIIKITMSNEVLGWNGEGPDSTSDIEIQIQNTSDVDIQNCIECKKCSNPIKIVISIAIILTIILLVVFLCLFLLVR